MTQEPVSLLKSPASALRLCWGTAKGCADQISNTNMALVSAGVAFFAMLSLFPALAALIAVFGLIADPVVVVAQLEEMRPLLPKDVYDIINMQVVSLVTAQSDTLGLAGIASILAALWSARAGVGAMMVGLNAVHDQRNRGKAGHYVRALMLTVSLVCVAIVALLCVIVAPVVLAFVPLGPFTQLVAEAVRWIVAVTILFVGVGLLYRYGPNRRNKRLPLLTVGAFFSVISWGAVSYGFSVYVANFGNYNQVYGSIGAVIAMLVWLWLTSFLILIGASLNAQLERYRSY